MQNNAIPTDAPQMPERSGIRHDFKASPIYGKPPITYNAGTLEPVSWGLFQKGKIEQSDLVCSFLQYVKSEGGKQKIEKFDAYLLAVCYGAFSHGKERHWNLLDEMYPQRSATFDELFTDIGARLIRLFQMDGSKEVPQCSRELFFSLLENKSAVLNSMLEMSDRADEKQIELRFSYERDNALFQRLMTECIDKEKRE